MPSIERWTFAAEPGFDLCAEMGSWVPDVERLGERACVRTDLFRESVVDGLDRAAAQPEVAPQDPLRTHRDDRGIRQKDPADRGSPRHGAMPRSWPSHAMEVGVDEPGRELWLLSMNVVVPALMVFCGAKIFRIADGTIVER